MCAGHSFGMKPEILGRSHSATDIIIGPAVFAPVKLPASWRDGLIQLIFDAHGLALAELALGFLEHPCGLELYLNLVQVFPCLCFFEGQLHLVEPGNLIFCFGQATGVMISRALGFPVQFEIALGIFVGSDFTIKFDLCSGRW